VTLNRASKGAGFYFLLLAAIVLFVFAFRNELMPRNMYSYQQFLQAVENNRVARVDIHPG